MKEGGWTTDRVRSAFIAVLKVLTSLVEVNKDTTLRHPTPGADRSRKFRARLQHFLRCNKYLLALRRKRIQQFFLLRPHFCALPFIHLLSIELLFEQMSGMSIKIQQTALALHSPFFLLSMEATGSLLLVECIKSSLRRMRLWRHFAQQSGNANAVSPWKLCANSSVKSFCLKIIKHCKRFKNTIKRTYQANDNVNDELLSYQITATSWCHREIKLFACESDWRRATSTMKILMSWAPELDINTDFFSPFFPSSSFVSFQGWWVA